MKKDINSRNDVETLVNEFYELVRHDVFIGPIFNEIIQDKWPQHLSKMYSFWETILLGNHTYNGAPFLPHAKLPLTQPLFDRWLQLFKQTLEAHFEGPVAKEAGERADKMALMFLSKIDYIRNNSQFKTII